MSGHHRWADTHGNDAFRRATGLERYAGMWCGCPLLDCCHNEMPEDNYAFKGGFHAGHHVDSGSPASGYLYPWEPGDESWRQDFTPPGTRGVCRSI